MTAQRPWLRLLIAPAAVLLAAGPAPAAMPEIGIVSAVVPAARATEPKQAVSLQELGGDLVLNERIETDPEGRAHIMFVDGSALSISGGSDIVLDRFVYDAEAKRGELVLSAGKGVFRLVGGRISKTNDIVMRTPTATIGVRGGIALIQVTPERTEADFLFGQHLKVLSQGVEKVAVRSGSRIVAIGRRPPEAPVMPGAQALGGRMAALEARPGGSDLNNQMPREQTHAVQPASQPAAPQAAAGRGAGQAAGKGRPSQGNEPGASPAGQQPQPQRVSVGDADVLRGGLGRTGSGQAPAKLAPIAGIERGPRMTERLPPKSVQRLAGGRPPGFADARLQFGPGAPPMPGITP
ncbi:MAG: FecR domain-containing protein [Alphaproteobacteria bacterium]|nr:FecR domain-containing protein [Alphaproteobacteria bacterium]